MGTDGEEAKLVAHSPVLKSPPAELASAWVGVVLYSPGLAQRLRHWGMCPEVALALCGRDHVETWPHPSP